MKFYADLHIHSKYSRATSRDCDLENLAYWGRKKGINVIGTGDFTHPAWIKEIKEKLVPAEPGLYRLRPDIEQKVFGMLPGVCHGTTRFMLSVEISTIYKKGDKVRKIHHLVYAPTIEKAEKINAALGKIGNIRSDGRPILGLDSRHLLEIVLSAGEDCYIVPAHIWTPWFAVLGSKSGFDDVAHCYGDLADHIFAVETGLSSDPEMNWKVSSLDRYALMSNSDAHSPQKLGREACLFETDLDYYAMRKALQTREGYGGTVEFFPEEGKYHMDGHRNCEVRLHPEESKKLGDICPVCKKPMTLGTLHRVEELADRHDHSRPAGATAYQNLIPLPEILSEINGVGPASQSVARDYEGLIGKLGAELDILSRIPVDRIQKASSSIISEAISRMRSGQVIREAGYDGEYGVIKLFQEKELKDRKSAGVLFDTPVTLSKKKLTKPVIPANPKGQQKARAGTPLKQSRKTNGIPGQAGDDKKVALDADQQKALKITKGPLLIIAGPGSGKTRTLTHRVAHLIKNCGAKPEECLTLTFTRRAADEMRERLQELLPEVWKNIPVLTFHGLGFQILQEQRTPAGLPRGFYVPDVAEKLGFLKKSAGLSEAKAKQALQQIERLKLKNEKPEPGSAAAKAWKFLDSQKDAEGWIDYADLMLMPAALLEEDAGLRAHYRSRWPWVSVDEYQDIDELQYKLLRLLVPENGNLCAIGDPDQAIYSFRGASVEYFLRFKKDFDGAVEIRLLRNYRSGESIVSASSQIITASSLVEDRKTEALLEDTGKITIHHAPTGKAEAEFIVHTIEQMLGGTSFFSLDTQRSEGQPGNYSFADFAVLYRTEAQSEVLQEAFQRSGIPFQVTSDPEVWDPRADLVSLMTLHASKGLEFPVVFIAGCEDGLLPFSFGKITPEEIAEERRLFYVGMTRAKDRLFLSHAAKRLRHGKLREQEISPFLKDIEQKLVEKSRANLKAKHRERQMDLL